MRLEIGRVHCPAGHRAEMSRKEMEIVLLARASAAGPITIRAKSPHVAPLFPRIATRLGGSALRRIAPAQAIAVDKNNPAGDPLALPAIVLLPCGEGFGVVGSRLRIEADNGLAGPDMLNGEILVAIISTASVAILSAMCAGITMKHSSSPTMTSPGMIGASPQPMGPLISMASLVVRFVGLDGCA